MIKEKFCEKYFENKVKPKHLRDFKAETPDGNIIEGYISRKSNKYLGSLVITHITDKSGECFETEQFIQAFPKIHYWDDRHKLKEHEGTIIYHCQEKLDGSCLIIYPLKDKLGNLLEIVPKSRTQAVADERILDMYNLIDKKAIVEFFNDSNHLQDSLMFELYGVLNRHDIAYMETYINIKLIGAYIDGEFLDYTGIHHEDDLNNFEKPSTIFIIFKYPTENFYRIDWWGNHSNLRNYPIYCEDTFPTLFDAVGQIKVMLKDINRQYYENNDRRAIEGVVINGQHFKSGQMYLKIKPEDVELEIKQLDSVPRRFIVKEVQKYFDEYGSKVKYLYQRDDTHYIKYVNHQLSEEFTYEQIEDPRTRKRINSVFMDVWDSTLPPASLQNICEKLIKENPDASISDLMKIFANTYPSKKRKSRFVYNILTSLKKRE